MWSCENIANINVANYQSADARTRADKLELEIEIGNIGNTGNICMFALRLVRQSLGGGGSLGEGGLRGIRRAGLCAPWGLHGDTFFGG